MARLFFALWPDRRQAAALADYAYRDGLGGGKRQRAENLHLTVLFLGDADAGTAAALADSPATGLPARFELDLDEAGWWREGGIAWLGPRNVPGALEQLRAAALAMAGVCGFEPRAERFRPHVTLARRAGRAPRLPFGPFRAWQVHELRLVASVPGASGARYQSLAEWPLNAPLAR